MHPQDMYENVKRGFTMSAMEKDFMRSLRGKVREWLEEMQKDQLFIESVGADDIMLGWYSRKNKQSRTGRYRAQGMEYEMDNEGLLFQNMRVKINIGTKEIIFENKRKGVELFRMRKETFNTSDWFGLTPDNFRTFLNDYCQGWCATWTLEHIYYGKTVTKRN